MMKWFICLSLIFAILKVTSVITWSWLLVLTPILIYLVIYCLIWFSLVTFAFIGEYKKNKREAERKKNPKSSYLYETKEDDE